MQKYRRSVDIQYSATICKIEIINFHFNNLRQYCTMKHHFFWVILLFSICMPTRCLTFFARQCDAVCGCRNYFTGYSQNVRIRKRLFVGIALDLIVDQSSSGKFPSESKYSFHELQRKLCFWGNTVRKLTYSHSTIILKKYEFCTCITELSITESTLLQYFNCHYFGKVRMVASIIVQ